MVRGYLPFIAWMVFMTIMLLMPSKKVPSVFKSVEDWLLHIVIMLISVLLLYFPFRIRKATPSFYLKTLLMFLCYSIVVEAIQEYFIPGRGGAVSDVVANMTGVLLGLGMVYVFSKKHH